jgi:hypothetical protein
MRIAFDKHLQLQMESDRAIRAGRIGEINVTKALASHFDVRGNGSGAAQQGVRAVASLSN